MADTIGVEKLLSEVKSYLHITWKDDNTDNNLKGFISRGMARLQDIAGVPSLDFITHDQPKSLLLDYCRYANSQALEMFEKNFESELLDLHLQYQLKEPQKLMTVSIAGTMAGHTKIIVSPGLDDGDSYVYKLGAELTPPGYFDICNFVNGYLIWDGSSEIEVTSGDEILIVEVDENNKAIRAGKTDVTVG
ncbi:MULTISPECIES: hypothetical protein [Clostridium]|uniref:S-layer protein SbsC C-terminal domain-containing protein n=1 Tax=Clostridium coskatii TaxID=1705578 RepID=A0A166TTX5_9CLOT|nr:MULTISPECIES: hypothetical protein [Clostridium]OAA94088.1 hypothetical protein WX73_03658 [Clostridium coskatii]OBR96650.1 hypothetical protein CLCOS_08120 [Clostridium coskatii]